MTRAFINPPLSVSADLLRAAHLCTGTESSAMNFVDPLQAVTEPTELSQIFDASFIFPIFLQATVTVNGPACGWFEVIDSHLYTGFPLISLITINPYTESTVTPS